MKCEKCGKTFYTKECLNCKNDLKNNKQPLSEKEKLFRIIRYAIIFIIGIFLIGIIIEIYMFNKVIDEAKPFQESMKKNLKNVEKMNEQLYKEIEKMGH